MPTMADLPKLRLPVPADLKRNGRWVDNGLLSNMNAGEAVVRFRSVATRYVEPAFVAAKNPDALVATADGHGLQAFHERVAATPPGRAKQLGTARGGIIDLRPDWEEVCIGAMASFVAQKFTAGTREALWLVEQDPVTLVEWTNWGDTRWGVAFRDGASHATGHNALGLLLIIGRSRLLAGRAFPTAPEADWAALQASLVPTMARVSAQAWPAAIPEPKTSPQLALL